MANAGRLPRGWTTTQLDMSGHGQTSLTEVYTSFIIATLVAVLNAAYMKCTQP